MLAGCVRRYILLVPLAAALALLGCDSYKSDIAAVKRAKTLPGHVLAGVEKFHDNHGFP